MIIRNTSATSLLPQKLEPFIDEGELMEQSTAVSRFLSHYQDVMHVPESNFINEPSDTVALGEGVGAEEILCITQTIDTAHSEDQEIIQPTDRPSSQPIEQTIEQTYELSLDQSLHQELDLELEQTQHPSILNSTDYINNFKEYHLETHHKSLQSANTLPNAVSRRSSLCTYSTVEVLETKDTPKSNEIQNQTHPQSDFKYTLSRDIRRDRSASTSSKHRSVRTNFNPIQETKVTSLSLHKSDSSSILRDNFNKDPIAMQSMQNSKNIGSKNTKKYKVNTTFVAKREQLKNAAGIAIPKKTPKYNSDVNALKSRKISSTIKSYFQVLCYRPNITCGLFALSIFFSLIFIFSNMSWMISGYIFSLISIYAQTDIRFEGLAKLIEERLKFPRVLATGLSNLQQYSNLTQDIDSTSSTILRYTLQSLSNWKGDSLNNVLELGVIMALRNDGDYVGIATKDTFFNQMVFLTSKDAAPADVSIKEIPPVYLNVTNSYFSIEEETLLNGFGTNVTSFVTLQNLTLNQEEKVYFGPIPDLSTRGWRNATVLENKLYLSYFNSHATRGQSEVLVTTDTLSKYFHTLSTNALVFLLETRTNRVLATSHYNVFPTVDTSSGEPYHILNYPHPDLHKLGDILLEESNNLEDISSEINVRLLGLKYLVLYRRLVDCSGMDVTLIMMFHLSSIITAPVIACFVIGSVTLLLFLIAVGSGFCLSCSVLVQKIGNVVRFLRWHLKSENDTNDLAELESNDDSSWCIDPVEKDADLIDSPLETQTIISSVSMRSIGTGFSEHTALERRNGAKNSRIKLGLRSMHVTILVVSFHNVFQIIKYYGIKEYVDLYASYFREVNQLSRQYRSNLEEFSESTIVISFKIRAFACEFALRLSKHLRELSDTKGPCKFVYTLSLSTGNEWIGTLGDEDIKRHQSFGTVSKIAKKLSQLYESEWKVDIWCDESITIGLEETFQFRPIMPIFEEDTNTIAYQLVKRYILYDEEWMYRLKLREDQVKNNDFYRAYTLFQNKKYRKALQIFTKLFEENPADCVLSQFIKKCEVDENGDDIESEGF